MIDGAFSAVTFTCLLVAIAGLMAAAMRPSRTTIWIGGAALALMPAAVVVLVVVVVLFD